MYLNNCLPDTHEIARKRGRTTESAFISADPVRRFSNLWNLEIFSLTVKAAFNWHESEERLTNKDIDGRKQELVKFIHNAGKGPVPVAVPVYEFLRLKNFIYEATG